MYFPELLEEYKQLLQQMKADGIKSGSMYQEVKQAIEWMETGYDPAEFREATRVDAYPMDPYEMQSYMAYINDEDMLMPEFLQTVKQKIVNDFYIDVEPTNVDRLIERFFSGLHSQANSMLENKESINYALQGLSDNEKAAFIAVKAERISFSKVASMLGVSKSTIQSYVNRAQKKIRLNIEKVQQKDVLTSAA